MLRWYLVHTKPSGEALAQANLQRQGYEVYFPRAVHSVRRGGRWLERVVALFPRYLFLRLNEGYQALNPVRSTLGVAGVVRGAFVALSRSPLGRGARFTPGAAVTVHCGPFSGVNGIFERAAGAERVVVLLRLLGRDASVCVPADAVVVS